MPHTIITNTDTDQRNQRRGITQYLPPTLTIVGLGGCGTALLHKIAKHDWFLQHYKKHSNNHLKLITIDSATGTEDEADKLQMSSIDNKLRSWSLEEGYFGKASAGHVNLSRFTKTKGISYLVNDSTCNLMQSVTYVGEDQTQKPIVWWLDNHLNDPETKIRLENHKKYFDSRGTLGDATFANGVKRKRAVSKAIFYKAVTSKQNEFRTTCLGPQDSEYAIIAGLGGGTGSGMFLDYAREVKRASPGSRVSLYLILPTTAEGQTELANAAIALTELEYLKLRGEDNVFDHVFLTSLEPTGFSGGVGAADNDALEEFGDAYPYLFVNSLMYDKDGEMDNHNRYGFMYHASSFSIDYPIEKLKETREVFKKYLEKYETYTDKKADIVNEIFGILDKLPECAKITPSGSFNPDPNDTAFYQSKIVELEKLWKEDIVQDLQLEVVKNIDMICNSEFDQSKKDMYLHINKCTNLYTLIEYVNLLQRGLSTTTTSTDLNGKLTSIISKNLDILGKIGSYLCDKQRYLKHSSIVNILKELLYCKNVSSLEALNAEIRKIGVHTDGSTNMDSQYTNGELNKAQSELDGLNTTKTSLNEEIREVKKALLYAVSSFSSQGKNIIQIKKNLLSISTLSEGYCQHLQDKCRLWSTEVHKMHDNKKAKLEFNGNNRFDGEFANYQSLSIDGTPDLPDNLRKGLTLLEEGYSDYYYNLYRYIYANRHDGLINRIGRDASISPASFKKGIHTALGKINEGYGKLGVPNPVSKEYLGDFPLSLPLEFNGSDIVGVEENRLKQEIEDFINKLSAMVGGKCQWNKETKEISFTDDVFTSEEKKEINSGLRDLDNYDDGGIKTLSNVLYMIHDKKKGENGWESIKSSTDMKIKELEDKISKLKSESKFLMDILSKFNDISATKYPKYTKAHEELSNQPLDYNSVTPVDGNYKAISSWNSVAIKAAADPNATSLRFFDTEGAIGEGEITHIVAKINELYGKLAEPSMLGIQDVCYATGNNTWELLNVTLLISSQSSLLGTTLTTHADDEAYSRKEAMEIYLRESFATDNENSVVTIHTNAMPWACGLTLITSGNYLENVLGFQSRPTSGPFYNAYQSLKHNPLHHVLLLEKGKYVVREWIHDADKCREYSKRERDTEDRQVAGWDELSETYSRSYNLNERICEEIDKNSRPTNSNPEIVEFESSLKRNEI